jgi:hypothetical protein
MGRRSMPTDVRSRRIPPHRNDDVVSGARVIQVGIVAVALGTTLGCALRAPRYVVADPQSVPSRSDAYWQLRPRANAVCGQSTPDKGASVAGPAAERN